MIHVLGTRGMLGSMVSRVLYKHPDELQGWDRPDFDAEDPWDIPTRGRVVNCIGVIKPHLHDVPQAIKVNALFPHSLPHGAIQIATDCVFSGDRGRYTEVDRHDGHDVYGLTKSLGEAEHLINLRCSIVGPEQQHHVSLLDWFLAQTEVDGFTNHFWNGVTTYHFALIAKGLIDNDIDTPMLQHVVPLDEVSKYELLNIFNEAFDAGVKVNKTVGPERCDRTLRTVKHTNNEMLWDRAGYDRRPTIEQMIWELAKFLKA